MSAKRDPACSDSMCSYRAEIESGYYVPAERVKELEEAMREAEKGLGSAIWTLSNRHNAGTQVWHNYAEASEDDARDALDQLRAALTESEDE